MKAYQGTLDKDTGQFTFRGLPAGEYDLLIKVVGHVYEGLTLELEPPPAVVAPAPAEAPTSQPSSTSQPSPAKPRPATPPRSFFVSFWASPGRTDAFGGFAQ